MKIIPHMALYLSLSLTSLSAIAQEKWSANAEPVRGADDRVRSEADKTNPPPIVEAVTAVYETRLALMQLQLNKPELAKESLKEASKKMDLVLSARPGVDKVPASVDLFVLDSKADDNAVKRVTSKAHDDFEDDHPQLARVALREIASEVNIISIFVPIPSYPGAIRTATQQLESGNMAEAQATLQKALSTLVREEAVIPLPLIRAQALVAYGGELAKDKANKDQLNQILQETHAQITATEKYGYGSRKDLKDARSYIKEVQKRMDKGQDVQEEMGRLANNLQLLKERLSSRVKTANAH